MRNYNLDSEKFCIQVKELITTWVTEESQLFRSNVVDSSNFDGRLTFFELKNLTLKDQVRLSIASWYMPENFKFLLQLDLRETSKYLNLEDQLVINLLLESEAQMLLYLLETKLWSERDFFGNIITRNMKDLNKFFRIRKESTKVIKVQRKRGYHDHGSRVDDHKWMPSSDYTLTEMQNNKEAREESLIDTTLLAIGLIT